MEHLEIYVWSGLIGIIMLAALVAALVRAYAADKEKENERISHKNYKKESSAKQLDKNMERDIDKNLNNNMDKDMDKDIDKNMDKEIEYLKVHEKPAFECSAEIEEKAKRLVMDYDRLSENAKIHIIAEVLVVSFLSASNEIAEELDKRVNFKKSEASQAKEMKMLYKGFICGRKINKLGSKNTEYYSKRMTELHVSRCPIYRIFSQLNKNYSSSHFMKNTGVAISLSYKSDSKYYVYTKDTAIPMIDIKETMRNKNVKISLEEHMKNLKIPFPEQDRGSRLDTSIPASFRTFNRALIFYSDPTDNQRIEMPLYVTFVPPYLNFVRLFILKAVIVADGDKNDVYKMRVLYRPTENTEEFKEIANQKGCYFLYEYEYKNENEY
ncbi:hypothetical protein ENBRE01_0346 [Enteropsectra breve]|nr:hypothetical protein ENBRE01_0346 [Enteropsectra breve]